MSLSPRRRHLYVARMLSVAFALSVTVTAVPGSASADEIPHENYDYVSSDLGVLVSLLNTSILYFEASFIALYDEDTSGGSENLSAVNSLLGPAENVLDDLQDVAESYEDLSATIPSFAALADEETAFIGLENDLLEAREVLRSLSGRTSLTDNETILAMTAFNKASAVMSDMNASIDSMLVLAEDIISLSVAGEYPFVDSNLTELIESLRDLLYEIEVELVEIIEGDGGGGSGTGIIIEPFLTLWVSDTTLHLGDDVVGGGYLYYNNSFQAGRPVEIMENGSALLTVTTTPVGAFGFRFTVPIESYWLGPHQMTAFSSWSFGNLTSDPITIFVTLIPTSLSVSVNERVLSPTDTLEVSIALRDDKGIGVSNTTITYTLDGVAENLTLDSQGRYSTEYQCSELGIGNHTLSASYAGEMPYASSSSSLVKLTIDIPTTLLLSLFSDRVYLGYFIVGEGTLSAETPDNMTGMRIALYIDDELFQNATTDESGGFAFSIPSESLAVGGHVLRAEFTHEDIMWRHSEAEASFTVYTTKYTAKYPFWPIIPGWGGLGAPPEVAYNLFFGDYAYFGWLLMVGIIAVVVKTVRMRRAALARKAKLAAALSEGGIGDGGLFRTKAEYERVADLFDLVEPPENPNDRIVWSYNYLLRFLVKNRRVHIGSSMTHREIAKMLEAIGYPSNLVNRVTTLFEMARYSGTPMTESEMATMGGIVEQIKSAVLGGGRGYAA